jgi:hypothetical protein
MFPEKKYYLCDGKKINSCTTLKYQEDEQIPICATESDEVSTAKRQILF